jgi:hypothetical protein
MFNINWDIKIGNFKLAMVETVTITRDVELLSDTAIIELPATAYNKALDIESKIKRGDDVVIKIGYDDDIKNLPTEFSGFLESITSDGGSLKINCEDGIFLYRVALKDTELLNADVKTVLTHVNKEVSAHYPARKAFNLSCDYAFTYDKFVINAATGYDVLKKIQEEAKPNIYLKENTLHVHPQYSEIFGKVVYDFAVNVETSNLKYKDDKDRKFIIEIEASGKDGKVQKFTAGTTGGDKVTIKANTTDPDSLKKLAEEELKKRVYTGYEGDFTAWAQPFCDAGYKAFIKDADYEFKNGVYYVPGITLKMSKEGIERTVRLGKKIANE